MKIIALLEGIVNEKNLIKLLSGVLFCTAISTAPALAAEINSNTNTIDELNSLIEVLKSDDIVDNIETVANTVVDVDSEEEEEESVQSYAGANSSIPLTNFVFDSYYDKDSKIYTQPGENLSKSSAPFTFVAIQYGNGNISDVSIDGKSHNSRQYKDTKKAFQTNMYRVVTSWIDTIIINDSALTNLSNGTHTLRVVCSPSSRFDSNSKQQIKTIKFNLVD